MAGKDMGHSSRNQVNSRPPLLSWICWESSHDKTGWV